MGWNRVSYFAGARSLCCFWVVSEQGICLRELAKRFDMSPPAVGFSVERGEALRMRTGIV